MATDSGSTLITCIPSRRRSPDLATYMIVRISPDWNTRCTIIRCLICPCLHADFCNACTWLECRTSLQLCQRVPCCHHWLTLTSFVLHQVQAVARMASKDAYNAVMAHFMCVSIGVHAQPCVHACPTICAIKVHPHSYAPSRCSCPDLCSLIPWCPTMA